MLTVPLNSEVSRECVYVLGISCATRGGLGSGDPTVSVLTCSRYRYSLLGQNRDTEVLLGTGRHEEIVNRANLKLASSSTARCAAEVPGNIISSVTYRRSYLSEELSA